MVPEPPWVEALVRFLTHPLVSPLLLSIGVLGLVFELKAGAFGIGGLVSLVSLALFFGASYAQGLAGWQEALLLVIGLAALAIENASLYDNLKRSYDGVMDVLWGSSTS